MPELRLEVGEAVCQVKICSGRWLESAAATPVGAVTFLEALPRYYCPPLHLG